MLESGVSLSQAWQQLSVNSGLLRKWKRQLQRENHIASTTTQVEIYNVFPG